MTFHKTILFLFFVSEGFVVRAQTITRYNSFSYSVNEGLLQSTMNDMAFDKNNFCWLSFPNGIQKFDGKNFITVPVQPGLPDDKNVFFLQCSNGDLLISHAYGVSKYEINADRFLQVYTNHSGEKTPAQFIGEDDNIIYFYTETGTIVGIDIPTYKTAAETKTGLPDYSQNTGYRPKISDNIIGHRAALQIKSSLYLWDFKKRKILFKSAPFSNIAPFLLTLKNEEQVLYYNYSVNNALQLYNFKTNTHTVLFVKGKDDKMVGRCIIYPWRNKTLLSFSNRLYETDTTLQVLKSELVNFQNQPIAGTSSIARIKEDNFGNLFIGTITGGINKVIRNNYPVKYYGTGKKEDNFIMSILPDKKNNRVLAGSSNGLLVFDTMQRLIKHIKTLPGKNFSFAPNNIIKTGNGDYLLFNSGDKYLWKVSHDFSAFSNTPLVTSLPESMSGFRYFGNLLYQNDREAVIQTQNTLYRTSFPGNKTTEQEITNSSAMSGLFYNDKIIIHTNDELIFLNASAFKELKRVAFKSTGGVRCFAKDAANNIYMGSNKGIFKIDSTGKILLHLNKNDGLPDECIYAMQIDKEGLLWCSSNKGIFRINTNNSILQLKKEDGLQENEFNTNAAAATEDGEIFFGGVNGISSFYPSAINGFEEKINLLVTRIKVNDEDAFKDTAVWNIAKIDLPYFKNYLSFDFISTAGSNPSQYIYQYKMDGVDKQWIQNNDLQTVRYLLPPGDYVFKIYASRYFNKDAKPMKEIRILISPPFWKTWWFLTGLALLFTTLLAVGINRYNKIKYNRRLAEMEGEHRIQMERERISRDLHDNIGAYANAVLYNTELLQNEQNLNERNELMKDVKFASKDIITALRETVWALKKNEYSAQDCLLRIRNFIQPLSKYYQQINFKAEGEAPAVSLHSTKALNLVRIVQEAVSNSLKHSGAANISISSNAEKGKWKLTVSDDGIGFDYESINKLQPGNGLNNMKHRSDDSGFDLIVSSHPHTGTEINIIVTI